MSGTRLVTPMREALPTLLLYVDRDRICRFANDEHLEWYPHADRSAVGMSIHGFLGPEIYEQLLPYVEKVEQGITVGFTRKLLHVEGWKDATVRYVPHFEGGEYQGFYALAVDQTVCEHRFHSVFDGTLIGFWEVENVEAGALLRQNLESLLNTAEPTPECLALVGQWLDLCTVIELNDTARCMIGSSDNAIGKSLRTWVPDTELIVWRQSLLAEAKGERGFEAETVLRREDGTLVPVLLSRAFPDNLAEKPAIFVGMIDISERTAMDRQLARAEAELAQAGRIAALGELSASIAHEVNQPLAAIVASGNAGLRWLQRPEPDLAEALKALQWVVEEGERASKIIAKMQQLATKGEVSQQHCDINEAVTAAIHITRRQATSLGASFVRRLSNDVPRIKGDPIQLQQVLINLIINAAQAMALQETPRLITLETWTRDGTAMIAVEDTGPGLAPNIKERVFDAFVTTKTEGMGLGLAIVQTIVRAHGGKITVADIATVGTRFEVSFPAGA